MRKYFTQEVKNTQSVEQFTEWIFQRRLSFNIVRDFQAILPGCTHTVYAVAKQKKLDDEEAYKVMALYLL